MYHKLKYSENKNKTYKTVFKNILSKYALTYTFLFFLIDSTGYETQTFLIPFKQHQILISNTNYFCMLSGLVYW